jgi:hypothetical protein
MPGPFTIETPSNTIQLDDKRQGTVVFNVINQLGRAITASARIVPGDPAQQTWYTIEGDVKREFALTGNQAYTVQEKVPPTAPPTKSTDPAATYTFRFDEVGEVNPDEEFTNGPTVTYTIQPPKEVRPIPWLWIGIGAGVLLLVVIGIVVFILTRPKEPSFAGDWVLNFGTMHLEQNGNSVTGNFQDAMVPTDGSLSGSLTGSRFDGTWNANGSGPLTMTLGTDVNTITGLRNTPSGVQQWCGAKVGQPFPADCSFAGHWNASIDGDLFTMDVTRTNSDTTGVYAVAALPTATGNFTGTVQYLTSAPASAQMSGGFSVVPFNTPTPVGPGPQPTRAPRTGTIQFFIEGYNAQQFRGSWSDSSGGNGAWCGWRDGQPTPVPATCRRP